MSDLKINKKVSYAIRMYDFHNRLAKKNFDIIKEWIRENVHQEDKVKKTFVIDGQVSFMEDLYERKSQD